MSCQDRSEQPRIGILGGTFNPIHFGHLLLGVNALETFQLDNILFMPSGYSYFKEKESIASGQHRLHMLERAIADYPAFTVSDMELHREGPSYSHETLQALHREHPDWKLFFIIGADNLYTLTKWKNFQEIFQLSELIVAYRNNDNETALKELCAHLADTYQAVIHLLPSRRFDISSTEIRERVCHGQSIRYLLPDAVIQYITEHQLYHFDNMGEC